MSAYLILAVFLVGFCMVAKRLSNTIVTAPIAFIGLGVVLANLGSLFIVRPLAIWLSLTGTDAPPLTRLIFGWFGPRGLATALFALLVVDQLDLEAGQAVLNIAINAVWTSAVLHGISAAPEAVWYARRIAEKGDCPEVRPAHVSARTLNTLNEYQE